MATSDLETLVVRLEARITDFEKGLSRAEKKAQSSAKKIEKSFAGIDFSRTAKLVAGFFGAQAITGFIKNSVQAGAAIADLAKNVGISAEALQELQFVFSQTGSSAEAVEGVLRAMTKFMADLSRGGKDSVAILQQLGLSFNQLRTQSPDQLMVTFLDALTRIENPLQRNATAMAIFGKSAQELGQVAQLGAAGIAKLREEARATGQVASNEAIDQMDELGDKITQLETAARNAGINIASKLTPAMDALMKTINDPAVQANLARVLDGLASVVNFLAEHPEVLAILAALKFGGVPGALAAGAAGIASGAIETRPQWLLDALKKAASGGPEMREERQRNPFFGVAAGASATAKETAAAFNTVGAASDALAKKQAAAAEKVKDVSDELVFQTEQLGRSEREQAIYNAVNQAGVSITSAAGRAIAEHAARLYDLQQAQQAAVERMDLFRDAARTGLSTFIGDLREGKDAVEALGDALDRVTDRLIDFALNSAINALLGQPGTLGTGLLGSLTGRASGGPVSAGQAYAVGETGPEVFVPRTGGVIGHGRPAGSGVEVNVINNAGAQVGVKEGKTSSGGVKLDVTIDQIVAAKGRDPASNISRMLSQRGAAMQPIRR